MADSTFVPTSVLVSVLIIEDLEPMRKLLSLLIGDLNGFRVSGSAENSFEALLELERRRPDLVLLDLQLGTQSGCDLLPVLANRQIPVLLLSTEDSDYIDRVLSSAPGAEIVRGRLLKPSLDTLDADRERIAGALQTALRHQL